MDKTYYLEKFKNYSDETLEAMLKTGNYNAAATAAMVEILDGTNSGVDYQALAIQSQQKAIRSNSRIPATNIFVVSIVSFIFWKLIFWLYKEIVFVAMVESVGLEMARELSGWILRVFSLSMIIGYVLWIRSILKKAKQEAIEDGEIEPTQSSPDGKM